jgi:hypothetical protein
MISHVNQFHPVASNPWKRLARTVPMVFIVACLVPLALINFAEGLTSVVLMCAYFAAIVSAVYVFMNRPYKHAVSYKLVQVMPAALPAPPAESGHDSEDEPSPEPRQTTSHKRALLIAALGGLRFGAQRAFGRHPRRRNRGRATL